MKEKPKLLIVDDEKNILKSLKRLLIDIDCKIFKAESGEEGLELFEDNKFQVVISDYRMPGMTGVEFLSKVKEKYPDTIRIVLSGFADTGAIVEAINMGNIYKFIPKPWDDQNLLTTVKDAFEKYELQEENKRLYKKLKKNYSELKELTKTLEDRVSERTQDLEWKNKALTAAHNILNYLPIGVIGIDSSGTLVYMNKSISEFIDTKGLLLGESAELGLDNNISMMAMDSLEEQKSYSMTIDETQGFGVICSPLPNKSGVIGLFACFDLSRCKKTLPYSAKLAGVNND